MMLLEERVFVDETEVITAGNRGALSKILIWVELPEFVLVQAWQLDTSWDEHTLGGLGDIHQWSLNTVENCLQNTRSEFD